MNTRALLENPTVRRHLDLALVDTADRREITNIGRLDLTNVWLALKHGVAFLLTLFRRRPDVVYLPISQNTLGVLRDSLFMVPALLARKRLVLHLRGGYFRGFYESSPAPLRAFIRWILRRAARVVVLGDNLRYIFEGLTPDARIAVIPNGLDREPFDRLRGEADRRTGRRVTYLGNLMEEKGYRVLLEAAPEILDHCPAAQLTFVGAFYRRESAEEAERFIAEAGLDDGVSFRGVVTGDEKVRLLLYSDIFVFPTYYTYEGHPMVVLEAMAAGLPVITTDQGAIRETVLDGENGFLVPKRDPHAVAEKVCHLLEEPELRRRMGRASRQRFLDHYTLERWSQDMVRLFEDALSSG